ncbi:MAG TPA: carboxypeptidase regulatory-like domain-containing protein [Candidatus Sulfotelmatobacter sp.]|nr:carboxypeptidase regulatory-like domain-containing protein [Candidatus Sulfotelmatobacter sp.]
MQTMSLLLGVCLVILSLSTVGLAQELAATLTGTVTDPSGAVVPGATVSVHSDETGADRAISTGSSGNFNITNLPAGRYTVTVKSSGFQAYVARDVILNVAEKHTLDVGLVTGKVTETLEVTAENTPIQTTTAEESGTVTGDQVRELALDNRNFEQLVLLQPGVSNQLGDKPGFGLSSNTSISINGARTGANNWTVDGADINDSGSNGTLLNTPSIDAIQEFTLERSNYDASFGRSGGGQIVVATKSGTNQFHGSAYEFNRNNFYNANTFGNRANIAAGAPVSANQTPIERYNDYGFTLGGPLFIPKVFHPAKDRTYFFWSEEWRKASTPGTNTITVPTAAELSGVFTAPIPVAPAGCVTTVGTTSTISSSCFSKNANAYLNAFMNANPAGASGQLVTGYSQLNNFRQDNIRLDQNLGDKVRLYARYLQDSVPQNFPFGLWGAANYPGVETTSLNAPGRNLVINATATLSPKIVNEVEFVDSYGAINSVLTKAIADSPAFTSTLTNNTVYQDPYGRAPNISFASGAAGLTNTSAPYFERNKDKNIFDNLSIQHGNHTIRTGLTSMWMVKTENGDSGAATFNFSGANGNPEFANFLLGQSSSYTQQSKDTVPFLHYVNFEAYVQDDWKVTRRLTLNIGVRYSYFPSPSDSHNTLLNFDSNAFQISKAPVIDPATGQMAPGNDAATYANGLVFPTGAACTAAQAIGPLVTCSPYGSRVNPSSNNNWGPRLGLAYDPFGDGKWAVRAGYGLFYDRTLNGIWEQNAFNDPPLVQTATVNNNGTASLNVFDNPTAGAPAGAPLGPASLTATGIPTFTPPSYQDYNLSVQHEIMHNTVLEVGYVGTKGTHLLGDININQPTVATRLANPTDDANALVPYPGYQAIVSRAPIFTSNYNSLQVSLNRRLSQGLTFGVAYTWSKLLTTNPQDRSLGVADAYNLKGDYGLSTLNTPQILVVSYVYELPFYRHDNSALGHVLGGWELSGITNVQSGQSNTVTQGGNDPFANAANNQSGLNLARGATAQIRTDLIGDPRGPKTAAKFFNTAAFATAVGHFGSEAPGTVLGPGFQLWDISLIKNVKFGERAALQLRLETFNAFNHGSPSGLNTDIGNPAAFGSINGWHDPRTMQLGVKIKF